MRLIELEGFTTERWLGEVLPVPYKGTQTCGRCGAGSVVELDPYVAVPLFRHDGHGEATRITALACMACGKTAVVSRQSLNPRSYGG